MDVTKEHNGCQEKVEVDPQSVEELVQASAQNDDDSLSLAQTAATHKEHMDHFLHSSLLAQKKHHLMTEEKYNALLVFLRDPEGPKCDPKFRHWATKRHDFALQVETVDSLTVEKIVVSVSIMDNDGKGSRRVLVTVIPAPALFDVTEDIHSNKLNHAGYKRVKLYAEDHYYGITRAYVQEFCRSCPVCRNRPRANNLIKTERPLVKRTVRPFVKRVLKCNISGNQRPAKFARRVVKSPLQSVLTASERCTRSAVVLSESKEVEMTGLPAAAQFMASVQVDLIDMSARPDGEFHYICHMLDFFSRYHILFPLRDSSPNEISRGLRDRVFAYFGPAKKMYIGGGDKFIQNALPVLAELWPDITIIQGKKCDAISSERIAKAVDSELATIKKGLQVAEGDLFAWTNHLATVMFSLNLQKPDPKLDTPFGVVLGRPPLTTSPLPGLGGRVIEEEQLEDLIGELLG